MDILENIPTDFDTYSKQCSKCREIKSLDEFAGNKDNADGYSGHCKGCYHIHYLTNKEIYNARALLRYYDKRGTRPSNYQELLETAGLKQKKVETYKVDLDELKTQLSPEAIERFNKSKAEWRAIFAERGNDCLKLFNDYQKNPQAALDLQIEFHKNIRSKWKLKYKNDDKYESHFQYYVSQLRKGKDIQL